MNHLEQLQKDAGLDHCPTMLTYELRLAVEGEPDADDFGSYAYEWTDKPHRLVFDACQEIERQAVRIKELDRQLESFKAMAKRILDMHMNEMEEICGLKERIAELEECLRMCAPYLPEATATKDEVMEVLGGDA